VGQSKVGAWVKSASARTGGEVNQLIGKPILHCFAIFCIAK